MQYPLKRKDIDLTLILTPGLGSVCPSLDERSVHPTAPVLLTENGPLEF